MAQEEAVSKIMVEIDGVRLSVECDSVEITYDHRTEPIDTMTDSGESELYAEPPARYGVKLKHVILKQKGAQVDFLALQAKRTQFNVVAEYVGWRRESITKCRISTITNQADTGGKAMGDVQIVGLGRKLD